jgi:cation:H+ antiporter
MIEIILFLLGLLMLVKASDYFVKSAASIAKVLGVSELLIGLTLVAIGTSIPELATAVISSVGMENEIASGNIVGAGILNIGAVLGISAMTRRIETNEDMLKRDGYIMILAMVLFYVFALDLVISRLEALALMVFYLAYVMFLFRDRPIDDDRKYHFKEFVRYFFRFGYLKTIKDGVANGISRKKGESDSRKARNRILAKEGGILMLSGIAVIIGARFFIDGALYFAEELGVSGTYIGVTLVSMGTTLPEMTVSVTAARKGFGNIAVGNVVGSNIVNIFFILGLSGFIYPLTIAGMTIVYAAPFMIFMGLLILVFIKTGWAIKRWEGFVLFSLYLGFMAFLFLNPQ